MESQLVIIRGNSGSGKTTAAKRLQHELGRGTLLVSQDIVRRVMLKVHDRDGNLSIDLIRQIAEYGKDKCPYVIVEGILNKDRYGDMLRELIQFFHKNVNVYYFDLSYEETVKRHYLSSKRLEFGEELLKKWWTTNDVLGVEGEVLLTCDMSEDDVLQLMLNQFENR